MPRGNGKTQLAAVLALYCLFADGRKARVLTFASDERQARHVFNACRRMSEPEPRLAEQVQIPAEHATPARRTAPGKSDARGGSPSVEG